MSEIDYNDLVAKVDTFVSNDITADVTIRRGSGDTGDPADNNWRGELSNSETTWPFDVGSLGDAIQSMASEVERITAVRAGENPR